MRWHSSEETTRKVAEAFCELDAQGVVVMPSDIARKVGVSRDTVGNVLRDASYWTPLYAERVRAEARRRGHETQRLQDYPNCRALREHGVKTVLSVEAAFLELDERGVVVMPGEIARMCRLHPSTVSRVLRDAPYWTTERLSLAYEEGRRRSRASMLANQAERGYPHLKEAGEKARQNQREKGFPNLRNALRQQHRRGQSLPQTHPRVQTGIRIRLQILDVLREAVRLHADRPTQREIGRRLEMDQAAVWRQLRRMRADGWIDEQNRPLVGTGDVGAESQENGGNA